MKKQITAKEVLKLYEDKDYNNDDYIWEFANLLRKDTNLPFILHYRTTLETKKGKRGIPNIKVYKNNTRDTNNENNFTVFISDNPKIISKHINNKFAKEISSKDLNTIFEWIKINKRQLLNFWENGMHWTNEEITKWKETLIKNK